MKQIFSLKMIPLLILLLGGLFLTSQVMAFETEAQVTAPAIVNTGNLNVRSGPGVEYGVLDVLSFGEIVTMLGRNADASWVYIRTADLIEGWVNSQYLNHSINLANLPVVGAAPGSTATPTPVVTTPTYVTGVVNTGALNVRSGPGVQYGVIDAVYSGDVLILVGRNADSTWINVQTPDNVVGWVNARYLNPSQPFSVLPVVSNTVSTPTPAPPGVATATPTPIPPGATAVPPGIPGTGFVNTAHLNVRSGPGVGYTRVTAVDNGDLVSLMGRNLDNTWVMIGVSTTQQGWVNARYITSNSSIAALPVAAQSGTGYVATGNLNIRSTPGVGTSVVTVMPYGASVVLLGRSSDNTWLYLRANDGKEGWANAAYLVTTMNVNLLPVLSGAVPGQPAPLPPTSPIPPINPGSTASLRACPNLSCPVTGTVYSGLAVTATGRNADSTWVYVVLSDGQQGWIQAQYVVLAVPINTLPVVNTTPTG